MTTLLVAATGGHLAQLYQLRPRLVVPGSPVVWVTFDSPQSRSMLEQEVVEFVPYTPPRGYWSVVTNTFRAIRILRRYRVRRVISTGSGIALAFLPIARAMGRDAHYIESAARSDGPSTTGRMLQRFPGIKLSAQYSSWAKPPWNLNVSVFDDFQAVQRAEPRGDVRSVVVTLGTIEGYGFRSLLERLVEIIPEGVEVLWQTGVTDVSGLALTARPSMPQHELQAAIATSDAVVAHAGIGSALGSLNAGRRPVLVPRRSSRGEHVDDHQLQIAKELDGRDLSISREVDELMWADIEEAARWHVSRSSVTQ
ncbi:UDP-N-acetylglucosamine:LPS N-acetylglucosamine transferase [Blastococcus colisei]|uniref:UDP-N-acetylglucosamine:LPS N-acetylglucosamine transferase n=1 Tax=Blastococcus colisei TaxID=1564162 RepID=A0A543P1K2_9ACTN|nr:glycosyltransferase [Blastococcus colisei]TQN37949.1 UDP-N-acetylglucosamine:LPS N-acetylglucosamine transferase [Blastococcus colisei]